MMGKLSRSTGMESLLISAFPNFRTFGALMFTEACDRAVRQGLTINDLIEVSRRVSGRKTLGRQLFLEWRTGRRLVPYAVHGAITIVSKSTPQQLAQAVYGKRPDLQAEMAAFVGLNDWRTIVRRVGS